MDLDSDSARLFVLCVSSIAGLGAYLITSGYYQRILFKEKKDAKIIQAQLRALQKSFRQKEEEIKVLREKHIRLLSFFAAQNPALIRDLASTSERLEMNNTKKSNTRALQRVKSGTRLSRDPTEDRGGESGVVVSLHRRKLGEKEED